MKLAILCEAVFPENKGGVERWFYQLSTELSLRGHEVTYLNAAGVNEMRNGVSYTSITREPWSYLPGGVRSKKQAFAFAFAAFRKLSSMNIDAIYATAVPILSVFPVSLVRLSKRRVKTFVEWFEIWPLRYWLDYAGIISGSFGWLIQFIALQVGKYRIVYTSRAARSIARNSLTSSSKNIIQLPGLCSSDFIKPAEEWSERKDITFLGRFVDEKQPILAIESVEEFIKTGWDGKFWIIGKGPSLQSMKDALATKPGLAQQIHLVEDATDEAVDEYLRNSFVLLHPSKREGYGLASVEAAYVGTPSILLNYPNNATLDLQISPSLVVNELNPRGIAAKLEAAFENQISLRKSTFTWAENASINRSLKSTADKIEELLGVTNED